MKTLKDLRIDTNNQAFIDLNAETCSIGYMYLSHLHPLTTQGIWRIVIVVGEPPEDEPGEVYIVNLPFDFKHYFSLDRYHKKKCILDIIHTTMMRLSKTEGFDQAKLQAAYDHCLAENLEFRWQTPYKRSPDHRHYGALAFHWDVDYCQATAIITDKNKEVQAKHPILLHPAWWLTYSHRKHGWENPTTFYLESIQHSNGREFTTNPERWRIDITKIPQHNTPEQEAINTHAQQYGGVPPVDQQLLHPHL